MLLLSQSVKILTSWQDVYVCGRERLVGDVLKKQNVLYLVHRRCSSFFSTSLLDTLPPLVSQSPASHPRLLHTSEKHLPERKEVSQEVYRHCEKWKTKQDRFSFHIKPLKAFQHWTQKWGSRLFVSLKYWVGWHNEIHWTLSVIENGLRKQTTKY